MSADHFDVLRAERGFLVEPDGVGDAQRQGGAFGCLEFEQLLVEFAALGEAVRESKTLAICASVAPRAPS